MHTKKKPPKKFGGFIFYTYLCIINQSKNNTMKAMFSTLNQARKENPSEFYGGIAFMTILFVSFYVAMWIFY